MVDSPAFRPITQSAIAPVMTAFGSVYAATIAALLTCP